MVRADPRGRGVIMAGEREVHVAGALPGELVDYRYLRRSRRFDEAETLTVLEPSPDRGEARCPHFDVCGGCAIQHMDGRAQLAHKERTLIGAFRARGLAPERLLPPLPSPAWGYRRRARLAVRYVPRKGGVLVGFREKSGNRVADMTECHVVTPAVGRRIGELRELIGELSVHASVPQIEMAAGDEATALVVRHLEPLDERDRGLLVDFARRTGIQLHLQPGGLDTVHPLEPANPPRLSYRIGDGGGIEMVFRPTDFVQVNGAVNRVLVDRVVSLADPVPGRRVLDLFSGIGNFALALAARGAEVIGVEGEPGLVEGARGNAVRNRIAGASFEVADLFADAERIDQLLAWRPDVLVLDPPRSGAEAVVGALAPPAPARVVYVSCNPDSLARDAAVLAGRCGYRVSQLGLVDMFPHTGRTEALGVFERGP